nr:FGGY-family carbohydrate kinase [Baekduia soli]
MGRGGAADRRRHPRAALRAGPRDGGARADARGRGRGRRRAARRRRRGRRAAGQPRRRGDGPRRGGLLHRHVGRPAARCGPPGRRRARAPVLLRPDPGRWVVGGAVNNGGLVLEWAGRALAPDLGEHPEEALLALAAQAPAGSDGLLMLPQLVGERAPDWDAEARGAYVGLTRAHGRAHLVRAALEGVCQQLALVLASMREAGDEVREVRATGGFARSALWRQILCDVLDMPVAFPSDYEGSGLGAALLGRQALGLPAAPPAPAALADVLHPDPAAAAVHARMRPAFAALHDALGAALAQLRDPGSNERPG